MPCAKKETILTLKRPSRLDKIIEDVPKPKEAIPNFGLAKWKSLPLDSKIPVYPSPEKVYNFSRQKLGQKLRVVLPDATFNLNDPYNRELDSTYNALHDKHLAHFFSRPNIKNQLINAGLVTSRLNVKCTVKDYNSQRVYWRKIYGDVIQNELRKKDDLYRENKTLEMSENMALKEAKLLQNSELKRKAEERRKLKEDHRLKMLLDKLEKQQEYFNKFMNMKRDEYYLRKREKEAKILRVQQTINTAKRIEKFRLLTIFKARQIKDRKRIKEKEKRLEDARNDKINNIHNKWQMKQEFQEKASEEEKSLLSFAREIREKNIENYDKKIKKERQRMQELFERKNKFVKCYFSRYISHKRLIKCCKSSNKMTRQTDGEEESMKLRKERMIPTNIKKPRKTALTRQILRAKLVRPKKSKKKETTEPAILQLFSLLDDQLEKTTCECYTKRKNSEIE